MKSNGDDPNHLVDSDDFWLNASESSLVVVWDNPDDDIYAKLLEGDFEITVASKPGR